MATSLRAIGGKKNLIEGEFEKKVEAEKKMQSRKWVGRAIKCRVVLGEV